MGRRFSDLQSKRHDTAESRGRSGRSFSNIEEKMERLKQQALDDIDEAKGKCDTEALIRNNRRRFNDLDDLGPDPENLRAETSEKLFGSPYKQGATPDPSQTTTSSEEADNTPGNTDGESRMSRALKEAAIILEEIAKKE